MTNISEMLIDGRNYRDLACSHPESVHKGYSIVMGSPCGAEARHSNTADALTIEVETVESSDSNEQGQRGVEAT